MNCLSPEYSFSSMPDEMVDMFFSPLVEQDGDCASLRLIDSRCRGIIDDRLRSCWERLKREAPEGPVDLPDLMERVEGEKVQERSISNANPRFLFQRLAREFADLGAVLPKGKLCTTPADYADLQNQIESDALMAIWRKANEQLRLPHQLNISQEVVAWCNNPGHAGYLDSITELDLRDLKLKCLPAVTAKFIQLRFLGLINTQLTELPKIIGKFSQLQELHLARNQLVVLSEAIGDLSQLEILDLDCNLLTSLPREVGKLSRLRLLYLVGNRLTTLPAEIGSLSQLESFRIYINPLLYLPDGIVNSNVHCIRYNSETINFMNSLAYPCASLLGQLYQSIMRKAEETEIKERFDCLPKEARRLIFEMVWIVAGRPQTDEGHWGKLHAFEDTTRFYLAVRMAIPAQMGGLTQEQKGLVYEMVYQLSEAHSPLNSLWGEMHALDNLPLLSDAISAVRASLV